MAGDLAMAIGAFKVVREALSSIQDGKVQIATQGTVIEAMKQLGAAQDQMFEMRDELFRLQEQNKELKSRATADDQWAERKKEFQIVTTDGGAVVYKSLPGAGRPADQFYACFNCMEDKIVAPLQDNRTRSGKYRCTKCQAEYPIKPQEKPPSSQTPTGGRSWMTN